MNQCFILREYVAEDVEAIAELVLGIQQKEFGVPITREEQRDLLVPEEVFGVGRGCFYVVEYFGRIVACAGLQDCGGGVGQIRKMFVAAPHRGAQFGLAARLMRRLLVVAQEQGIMELYLGTVTRLKRARAFYKKWGFEEISRLELPPSVQVAAVDDKMFRLSLRPDGEFGEATEMETLSMMHVAVPR